LLLQEQNGSPGFRTCLHFLLAAALGTGPFFSQNWKGLFQTEQQNMLINRVYRGVNSTTGAGGEKREKGL